MACKQCEGFEDRVIECCNGFSTRSVAPGICWDCPECQSQFGYDDENQFQEDTENGSCPNEGGFSWQDCECCGSSLGGDRYAAHGLIQRGNTGPDSCRFYDAVHLDICVDCLQYLANGYLPTCCEEN